MSEAAAKKPVRVTIYNQSFSLLAQGDPAEVEAVANEVDELLHSIADRSPSADASRIAVLACMHLADRLRSLERDKAALESQVKRTEQFVELLEQAIEE